MMNMKVKGKQEVEIELSDAMLKHITLEFICRNLDWGDSYFIEDGKVYEIEEFATSHRWTENTVRREATPLDKCLYTVIKEIKKI